LLISGHHQTVALAVPILDLAQTPDDTGSLSRTPAVASQARYTIKAGGSLGIIIVQYSASGSVLQAFSTQSPGSDKIIHGRPSYLLDAGDISFHKKERFDSDAVFSIGGTTRRG